MQKIRVFADTNVILESFRKNCWKAICNNFDIETVEKCVEETLTGNSDDPRHIDVKSSELISGLAANHPVVKKEITTLILNHPSCSTLDDGEKQLFAWILANNPVLSNTVVVTTADKAALVAVNKLGWLDNAISLEELARKSGVSKSNIEMFENQYRENWLASIKTKIILGVIP